MIYLKEIIQFSFKKIHLQMNYKRIQNKRDYFILYLDIHIKIIKMMK